MMIWQMYQQDVFIHVLLLQVSISENFVSVHPSTSFPKKGIKKFGNVIGLKLPYYGMFHTKIVNLFVNLLLQNKFHILPTILLCTKTTISLGINVLRNKVFKDIVY